MPTTAMVSSGINIAGSLIGHFAAKADQERAKGALDAAIAQIRAVGAPPDLSAEIIKQKFAQVGLLDPKLEDKIDVGVSQVSQIQEQTETRDAQIRALSQLQQLSRGGLSAEDRAAYNKLRQETQRDIQAKQAQVLQNAQQRGIAGGGNELVAQLMASQSGAEQQSEQGDRIAAQAAQNALSAISQAGNLGGQVRTQDFNVASAKAQAADEFRRFDVSNQIARQTRNVAAKNEAEEKNLNVKQSVADRNVAQANAELERQAEAKRQYWQDKLGYANALAGGERAYSDYYTRKADTTRSTFSNLASGGAKMYEGSKKTSASSTEPDGTK